MIHLKQGIWQMLRGILGAGMLVSIVCLSAGCGSGSASTSSAGNSGSAAPAKPAVTLVDNTLTASASTLHLKATSELKEVKVKNAKKGAVLDQKGWQGKGNDVSVTAGCVSYDQAKLDKTGSHLYLNDQADHQQQAVSKNYENAANITVTDTTVAGHEAKKIEFDCTNKKKDYHMTMLIFIVGSDQWMVETLTAAGSEEAAATAADVLGSIQLQ